MLSPTRRAKGKPLSNARYNEHTSFVALCLIWIEIEKSLPLQWFCMCLVAHCVPWPCFIIRWQPKNIAMNIQSRYQRASEPFDTHIDCIYNPRIQPARAQEQGQQRKKTHSAEYWIKIRCAMWRRHVEPNFLIGCTETPIWIETLLSWLPRALLNHAVNFLLKKGAATILAQEICSLKHTFCAPLSSARIKLYRYLYGDYYHSAKRYKSFIIVMMSRRANSGKKWGVQN